MTELYVATDSEGMERRAGTGVVWPLPHLLVNTMTAGDPVDAEVVLCEPLGLLGGLDERIWRAAPAQSHDAAMAAVYAHSTAGADEPGRLHVIGAQLLAPTGWDGFVAAGLALDCAEHVMGDAAGVALPDGTKLADAIAQVRSWLHSAEETEGPFGKLHDLALGRRLRREGRAIAGAAARLAAEDVEAHVDALDDPVWTALEAARDAVLAAVEAVQHAVFPRLHEREAHHYEEEHPPDQPVDPAEQASFVPSWIAADDAAELARRAAADAGGEEAAGAELAWQAERLGQLLAS